MTMEFYTDCSVGVVNPATHVPGTDLIKTLQRFQPCRKPTDAKNPAVDGEPDDASHAVSRALTIAGGSFGP